MKKHYDLNIHPGEILKDEVIKAHNLSYREAAEKLNMSEHDLFQIIFNKKSISLLTAQKIEKAFGGSAGLWIRLQSNYDKGILEKEKLFEYNYHYYMYTFLIYFIIPCIYCYFIINVFKVEPLFNKKVFWVLNWAMITGLISGTIGYFYRKHQMKKLMKKYE